MGDRPARQPKTRSMSRFLSLAALASLALASPCFAQATATARATSPATAQPAGLTDQMFSAALSAANLAEIAAAKLALSRASDPEVKQYA